MKKSKKTYYIKRYILRSKYVPEVAIQSFDTLKEAKEYFNLINDRSRPLL